MNDERRHRLFAEIADQLKIDSDVSDESEVRTICTLTQDCIENEAPTLSIFRDEGRFSCLECDTSGSFEDLKAVLKIPPSERPRDADFTPSSALVKPRPPEPVIVEVEKIVHKPRPRGFSERFIMTPLALIFLCAGLAAATLSGFANYQAFSGSVTDALQSKVWGWTGVIASIISFGGFTFFYWHMANGRRGEGWRTALFALAGAATSIIGTQMYIDNNNLLAASAAEQAGSNRAVIEAQIEDWRGQLAGIPADTRTVEGLEAYIAEVERVGRTHQKPYRDAQNELGLAKRRDDLESKIESANAQLIGTSDTGVVTSAPERRSIPSWFFAIMLELFSSQGTSIASVALLILYGGRRKTASEG